MLLRLQTSYPGLLYVVQTQGALSDDQWRNEIHPTPEGFRIISEMIYQKVLQVTGS